MLSTKIDRFGGSDPLKNLFPNIRGDGVHEHSASILLSSAS